MVAKNLFGSEHRDTHKTGNTTIDLFSKCRNPWWWLTFVICIVRKRDGCRLKPLFDTNRTSTMSFEWSKNGSEEPF